jgi:hypothetical protein
LPKRPRLWPCRGIFASQHGLAAHVWLASGDHRSSGVTHGRCVDADTDHARNRRAPASRARGASAPITCAPGNTGLNASVSSINSGDAGHHDLASQVRTATKAAVGSAGARRGDGTVGGSVDFTGAGCTNRLKRLGVNVGSSYSCAISSGAGRGYVLNQRCVSAGTHCRPVGSNGARNLYGVEQLCVQTNSGCDTFVSSCSGRLGVRTSSSGVTFRPSAACTYGPT